MERTHTPAPWAILQPENERGQKLPPRIIQTGRAGIIATLGIPQEGDREANGRLLVVAPDMLAALRWSTEMMGYATYQLHPNWRSKNGGDFDDALQGALAVIAKVDAQ